MNKPENIDSDIQRLRQEMLNYFQTHWKLFLLEGILFILLGLCAVLIPQFFTVAIVIFLGWIILFGGAVHIGRALVFSAMPGFAVWLFMGILQLVVGYLFITQPAAGVLTLTVLMALFFAFEGIAKISLAFMMRPLPNWGLMLFSGMTALVFALIISISWSETSQWLLGLLLGINMIFLGWALVKISLHHKEIR
ncbi:HdeD family acid-resistance protein [Methylomicrobium lacus]|uniref:HdeD family acid-resistance protein n=1 Tax=Methylomicrobium lacus TaxID=136992 RepID=UPI0035A83C01